MTPKLLVTGARGFLGRHLMPVLASRYGADSVRGVSRRDYDLTDPAQVERMFAAEKPDIVIHLAGYVGGIGANRAWPASFFHQNLLMMALVFDAAARHYARKLIYPIDGCCYPATATSPIGEDQMWQGYPQPDSAAYASAKKMGLVASEAYRQQHGLHSVVVIPGNLYGEYDNFRVKESHVVPALVRRFLSAKRACVQEVVCWGTGRPARDFVYAGDVAATFPFFIEQYDSSDPVNLSSGVRTPIRELAETIRDLTGFHGDLVWDASKPDGQLDKVFDVTRMKSLGLDCPTPLREGLRKTISWFEANYDGQTDGLRV